MTLAEDLLAVLDDPAHMWTHALKELSSDAQRLFLTLTLLPKPVSSDVLQVAYTSQELNRSESFLDSLRSLEDSFISIEKLYANLRAVSFRNPSLEDFANSHLDSNSDWLDGLLSAPKYYEQIIGSFSLAMAQTSLLVDARDRSRKDAPPKYPGIKQWVERRATDLIGMAVNLLDAERAWIYSSSSSSRARLGQLLEIIVAYGMPANEATVHQLAAAATIAAHPNTQDSANVILELINKPTHRRLLDDLIRNNTVAVVRENVLDKDSWKFGVLAKLDNILKLDLEESWDSWGNDYLNYARQLAERLTDSNDDDDLRIAIDELESVGRMLDADLSNEIAALEERRRHIPQDDDYDDESQSSGSDGSVEDSSAQLHKIFATLL